MIIKLISGNPEIARWETSTVLVCKLISGFSTLEVKFFSEYDLVI